MLRIITDEMRKVIWEMMHRISRVWGFRGLGFRDPGSRDGIYFRVPVSPTTNLQDGDE